MVPLIVTASILDEVVDSVLEGLRDLRNPSAVAEAPGVLSDDSTVISRIDEGSLGVPIFSFYTEDLAAHQAGTRACATIPPSDTRDSEIIIVPSSYCPCYVRPVGDIIGVELGVSFTAIVGRDEVSPMDVIDDPIVIVVHTGLPILLRFVDIEVVYEVGVLGVDPTIDDSDDNVGLPCLRLPSLEETNIGTSHSMVSCSRIVVVPLVSQLRVIEWQRRIMPTSRGQVYTHGLPLWIC